MELPAHQLRPEVFEPFLEHHPDDAKHRENALAWYALYDREKPEKLKAHTRAALRWHPDCSSIYYMNFRGFDLEPAYLAEVRESLESALREGRSGHGLHANLARVHGRRAVPPRFESAADRQAWLDYFELPADYPIPTELDHERVARAAGHWRLALRAAGDAGEVGCLSMYGEALINLLSVLDRKEEAVAVASGLLARADREASPDLQLTYAELLSSLGRIGEAAAVYLSAIGEDLHGYEHGGHVTAHAHLALGEIALGYRCDPLAATEHLLAAAAVPPCCHTGTQGLPMRLARLLVEAGHLDAPEEFCQRVLEEVTPGLGPAVELLRDIRDLREGAPGRGSTA